MTVTVDDILETYRVLVNARRNMPGAKLETLFPQTNRGDIRDLLEQEEKLLKQLLAPPTTKPSSIGHDIDKLTEAALFAINGTRGSHGH